ncbi:hypothetical protein [Mucilaginibacter sp. UYCu711]|uniref:hypothetical protein n=1 Tax=Mucilaginibacter sp. UYCu711 TaxID=3156339 RepID=UPI003D1BC6BF
MIATILFKDNSTNTVQSIVYDPEEVAQTAFDVFTEGGSEHEGRYQWDLIAHHPTEGKLIRLTMFTKA